MQQVQAALSKQFVLYSVHIGSDVVHYSVIWTYTGSTVRYLVIYHISIIYSSRILCLSYSCLSSCRPVIFLSYSCHSCGTLSYSLCFSDQTDQGNETEGLEMEGL
jgi:hypothetical protein